MGQDIIEVGDAIGNHEIGENFKEMVVDVKIRNLLLLTEEDIDLSTLKLVYPHV